MCVLFKHFHFLIDNVVKVKKEEIIIEPDNLWEADKLPEYARTHIVSRKMKKDSIEARKKTTLAPLHEEGAQMSEKKLEAFKFSMLKTSLEHEPSNIIGNVYHNVSTQQEWKIKKYSAMQFFSSNQFRVKVL